jgi:hypothetical protein
VENHIREMTDYFRLRYIEKIREKLSLDGKLFDDLIFSVNPEDLEKCCYVSQTDFATYDNMLDKIWIWLFRLIEQAIIHDLSEDNVIHNIIFDIEHEWIHKLDSECLGKCKYPELDKKAIESIVALQQQRLL